MCGNVDNCPAAANAGQEDSDADLWRQIRRGQAFSLSGTTSGTPVLVQSEGEQWRALRNGPISTYGGWLLVLSLAGVALFFLVRGRVRLAERSGRTVPRFTHAERAAHWFVAATFVLLALSGLVILFGKYVLQPAIGVGAFAVIASAALQGHNLFGPLFAAGIDVPAGFVVTEAENARDPQGVARRARETGYPLVVKPVQQGSSFGISMVDRPDQLPAAVVESLRYDDRALVEERLLGTELTVGVIGREPDLVSLPVIEIVTRREFFDYKAKYDPELTDEICPARVSDEVARRAQELGIRSHRALGCLDLSRTDMILTADGRLPVLEVNTIPGMTANSLLPKAARVAGIPFGELLERLIAAALGEARAREGAGR